MRPPEKWYLRCGISVSAWDSHSVVDYCEDRLCRNLSTHICTVNPEIAMLCTVDRDYQTIISQANLRTIDGAGVAVALWCQHRVLAARLTGVMLCIGLTQWARTTGRAVMVVGSTNETRRRYEKSLSHMGVTVLPGASPEIADLGQAALGGDEIHIPSHAIVLVALGSPKQEYWIAQQISHAPPNVWIGVGGAIDYLSGDSTLPPAFIRRAGLEWLFRLCREPEKRLKRQLRSLPKFAWQEFRPTQA